MVNDSKGFLYEHDRVSSFKKHFTALIPILSLLVIIAVFWWLKLVGITVAGEAFCGMTEHTHDESCTESLLICTDTTEGHIHTELCYEITYSCGLEEHTHISSCYSDINADKETAANWEATIAEVSSDISISERITAIASTQLGYTESERNFTVDSEGIRHGYTRYGEWFGNPYGDWSVMFSSFCLRYAGLEDVPISAGGETMRAAWDEAGIYYPVAEMYTPVAGDVVFLDKNGNGTADATAIVTAVSEGVVCAIEGDVENIVTEITYEYTDPSIMGFGMSVPGSNLVVTEGLLSENVSVNINDTITEEESTTAVAAVDAIGKTVAYTSSLFDGDDLFILYVQSGENYYAIDGSANAVQINIDADGNVTADVTDPNTLYWSVVYKGDYQNPDNSYDTSIDAYYLQNAASQYYLHPCGDSTSVISGKWESGLYTSGSGVKIRGARQDYYSVLQNGTFVNTSTAGSGSVFYFAKAPTKYTVWLDGTNGGLMGLGGSPSRSYTVDENGVVILPQTWQSPDKYSYVLHGWFDVKNNRYYKPGTEVSVEENLVLYADWWAESYDVGQYNEHVSDTVSTNAFISTGVFDYNSLFNLHSLSSSISANAAGHSETWSMVTSGTVPYKGGETLDFVFCDYDSGGDISYANGRGVNNANQSTVTFDLYNDRLGEMLFDKTNSFDPETGEGIIGKKYLGDADHLFHFDSDPDSATRGYYYYDSKLNAASYNKTDNCFYVYDYLERTADSEKDGGGGEYSDFLPFNSPYANTNGNTVTNYTYDGDNSEYTGVTHYQYDAKYNTNNNSVDNVGTNYWFGMSIDIRFYLSNDPGETDAEGNFGNLDLYGNEMHFKFSGDDDMWVLIDGIPVLDVGGVHGIKNGDINFSTGVVTVEGEQTCLLQDIVAEDGSTIGTGEHYLTVYYLERGSSQSNCAIYFNISPRFQFTIQKEDVLTRDLLNGAEFTIYMDRECTVPAELWTSEEAYRNEEPSENVFQIIDGVTTLWGMSPGKTYYIVETKPPDVVDYSIAHGVICVSLDYKGKAIYTVDIVEELDENGDPLDISKGYTVHGFRVDEETQEAFMVVTNAYSWITETTTVQVAKEWNDSEDHSDASVTVYLKVTYEDGTTKRIREVELSDANNWTYTWTNLPKYWIDGVTEVVYEIEEAFVEGYYGYIEKLDNEEAAMREWVEAYSFKDGEVYILGSDNGFLATQSATNSNLVWISDLESAKTSELAKWTAEIIDGRIKFKNGAGYVLSFYYSRYRQYIYAGTDGAVSEQYFSYTETTDGIRIYYPYSSGDYYIGSLSTSNGYANATTTESSAVVFVPRTQSSVADIPYKVTNIPLDMVTSVTVQKSWDIGVATGIAYEKLQATVELYANEIYTGRSVTLTLKNNWTQTFAGLPYEDPSGNVIVYTVKEVLTSDEWTPVYGDVQASSSSPPLYDVTVTNKYKYGGSYELPSTGGLGPIPMVLSGSAIMAGALVCGYIIRRKRERRSN